MSRESRRDAVVSFLLLFGLMGSYSLLETARDTLFLMRLPAADLPWAYISTAVTVALVGLTTPRDARGLSRRGLSLLLLTVAAVLFAAVSLHPHGLVGVIAYYAAVSGAGTAMLVRTWTLIDAKFSVENALVTFGPIAAGGALGAIVAGFVATTLHDPYRVGRLGALVLAMSSAIPLLIQRPVVVPKHAHADEAPLGRSARALLAVVVLLTITATLGDFVFKSTVAAHTSHDRLVPFFAYYNLSMNTLGLLMQAFVAPVLLRGVGALRSVLALPALTAGAAIGFVLVPGLVTAIVMKSLDVILRGAVHRPATEVLYVPLDASVRGRVKGIVDGLGQRGGQALAAVLLFSAQALGTSLHELALLVFFAAVASVLAATRLRLGDEAEEPASLFGAIEGHAGFIRAGAAR